MGAIFDGISNLLAVLGAVLIISMMLLIVMDVGMRYFLGRPQQYVLEIVVYSLLYITFLGTTWVLKRDRHVRLTLVVDRLKPRARALLNITTSTLSAIMCLIIAWYGTLVTWDNFRRGIFLDTALEPSKYLILLIIPIGSFLLFIQFARNSYGYLASWAASRDKEQRP